MLVPEHWAESRVQRRVDGRTITVRRFGWSDHSEAAAAELAETRAAEAVGRIASGEPLSRRERKASYGIEGLPIREEVVARQGELVITRNRYGARCLNTENVLFADVDFDRSASCLLGCFVWLLLIQGLWLIPDFVQAVDVLSDRKIKAIAGYLLLAVLVTGIPALVLAGRLHRLWLHVRGGPERRAMRRIEGFCRRNPHWSLRVYRTPNGLRLLGMHARMRADDPEVKEAFAAFRTDPNYARMCKLQDCFRARLSAKPWNIGVDHRITPKPGVWPIAEERLPARNRWIDDYERKAQRYAACRYVTTLGNGRTDDACRRVRDLHDRECGATSGKDLA